MALYINDIKVEHDYRGICFSLEYKDKMFLMDRPAFNRLYDTMDTPTLYKTLLSQCFGESEHMMYDEYFGTDSYDVDRETERLKKLKIEQFERGFRDEKGKENKPTQKQVNRTKRNSTFWGMLVNQDIIDGLS